MSSTIRVVSVLLVASFLLGSAIAKTELPLVKCGQDFRSIDDQADRDVRDVDQLIGLLMSELGDTAIASGDPSLQNRVRGRLEAAKMRRADILDKQHNDLNAIRARCDELRDAAQQ